MVQELAKDLVARLRLLMVAYLVFGFLVMSFHTTQKSKSEEKLYEAINQAVEKQNNLLEALDELYALSNLYPLLQERVVRHFENKTWSSCYRIENYFSDGHKDGSVQCVAYMGELERTLREWKRFDREEFKGRKLNSEDINSILSELGETSKLLRVYLEVDELWKEVFGFKVSNSKQLVKWNKGYEPQAVKFEVGNFKYQPSAANVIVVIVYISGLVGIISFLAQMREIPISKIDLLKGPILFHKSHISLLFVGLYICMTTYAYNFGLDTFNSWGGQFVFNAFGAVLWAKVINEISSIKRALYEKN